MSNARRWQRSGLAAGICGLVLPAVALAQYPVLVTDFEGAFTGGLGAAEVIFRNPTNAAATVGVDESLPDFTFLADFPTYAGYVFPSSGSQALLSAWVWEDTSNPTAWVRLGTTDTQNIPNPSLHLGGTVTMQIAATAYPTGDLVPGEVISTGNLLIGLGIRETGIGVTQGSDGGQTGDVEWVGLSSRDSKIYAGSNGICETTATVDTDDIQVNPPGSNVGPWGVCVDSGTNGLLSTTAASGDLARTTPIGLLNLPSDGVVRSYTFDLPALEGSGNVFAFTGDATLGAIPNNRGTLEHMVITNDPANSAVNALAWVISIDDVVFEAPIPDPPTIVAIPAPEPLDTSVDIEDIDPTASLVEVILKDPISGDSVVGSVTNPGTTATSIATSPLPGGLSVVAQQTIGADVSDESQAVVISSPGNGPLRFATAIRETDFVDNALNCGDDGTGFDPDAPSTLEFIGANSTSGFGIPDGRRVRPEFGWRELTFDPCEDGVTIFSGDGEIFVNSTGLTKSVWEGLYYRIDDAAPTTGPYTIYLDDMTLINGSGPGMDCFIDDFDSDPPGDFIVGDFGGDGVANTTANNLDPMGDDIQVVSVNDPIFTGQIIVDPGPDRILQTEPEGDDGQSPLHARFNFPGTAGTSVGLADAPNLCRVTSAESFSGPNSLEVQWAFENASNLNSVVRHTTNGSTATDPPETLVGPDPVVELTYAGCEDGVDIQFSVMILFEPPPVPGDCDFDGDVDLFDSACFQRCNGNTAASSPECENLDNAPLGAPDGNIDLGDWELQQILTIGPR